MNKIITHSILTTVTAISANGAVISVDFNSASALSQVGLAAAPDANGATAIWNTTTGGSPTLTGAVDSSGTVTPVTVSVDSRSIFGANGDQELQSGQANLFNDYLSSRADNNLNDLRTGVIGGLIAGNSYDFYVYGQGDNFEDTNNNGGQNVGIRIGTDVRHTSYDGTPGGDGLLVEDVEYVLFSGLIADGNGEINFEHFNPGVGIHATDPSFFDSSTGLADADGNNSRFHAINGLQIVGTFIDPVPEPSSALLLALSGMGILARRRRA